MLHIALATACGRAVAAWFLRRVAWWLHARYTPATHSLYVWPAKLPLHAHAHVAHAHVHVHAHVTCDDSVRTRLDPVNRLVVGSVVFSVGTW